MTFAIIYRKITRQTRKEYENANVSLLILTATPHKLKGKKREPRVQMILSVNVIQTKTTHETVKLQRLKRKLVNLTKLIQTTSASKRKLTIRVKEMQRKIQKLTIIQENFQKRMNTFNEKTQQTSKIERNETMTKTEKQPLFKIKETERLV